MTVQPHSTSSRPRFTEQQAAAIETRGVSIALSAGAGCGKTFVLTQRFLKSLEAGDDSAELHSLVAITFTDKAAREMRDRIRSACQQRLQQCERDEVDHWLALMRGLDSARVSTIHSFCTSLLRSQAVEAGLDPRFGLLEPALANTLLSNTAKDVLHGLVERGDPDASAFVLQFGLERTRELLRVLAHQRFQIDFDKLADESPDDIAARWRTQWESEFVPRLVAEFRNHPRTLRTFGLLTDNNSTHATMQERRTILLQWLEPKLPWKEPLAPLQAIEEHARVQGGGTAKNWPRPEVHEEIKDAFAELRKATSKLVELLPINEDDLMLAAEFSCRALRLARLTSDAFQGAKQSQGLLDFDDLLLKARDLLRDNPDVRNRVGAGIRLLMVDEFQDTDPIQADVVRMLCGAALTRGRLFLVGDAKQSIYRFRRADPGVFAKLRQEIPERGRLPLNVNFRSQPAVLNFVNHLFAAAMGDNYEALAPFDTIQHSPTPAIELLLATSDAVEDLVTPTRSVSEDEGKNVNDSVRGITPSSLTLRVGVDAVPHETNAVASDMKEPAGKVRVGELRSREADWIARRCAELLSDPTPRIRAKDSTGQLVLRRIESGDIVILFRALSNVQEYESALRRYGLDYYLVGGKAFFAQQEVFDLLNLCRYLNDPDDLIGLVGILRSPFFNLSDDTIQALSRDRLTLHDSLFAEPPAFLDDEQQRRLSFARDVLTELRAVKDRLPLAELLTRAIERTGYDAALLTEHLGPRKVANLRKLIEMAAEFDRGELFTLQDFVERLHTSVLEETDEEFATTLPETGHVIRLMSIHQSKGLEFPVVIVADIDRKGAPRGSSAVLHPDFGALVKLPEMFGVSHDHIGLKMYGLLEQEADAEETIRLFYVACTRAADYLILSAGIELEAKRNSPWLELVESRFDLLTGLPKGDALLGSSEFRTAGRETIPEIFAHREPPAAKPVDHEPARQVPLSELTDLIVFAEPTEPPASARRWPREASDLPPISVSRLEEIDAQLGGDAAPSAVVRTPTSGRAQSGDDIQSGRGHPDYGTTVEDAAPVDPDQATTLGTLVHAVLEQIDFAQPDNWPARLATAATAHRDHVSEDVLVAARALLDRLFASPLAIELAAAKHLHREVEFSLLAPSLEAEQFAKTRIIGVIDVLYEDAAGGWHVLDYKTNDITADATDEQLLAPYEFQLGVYAHAVEQWFGVAPVEVSLVMLRPSIRRVSRTWTAARREQMRVRLAHAVEAAEAGATC